MGSGRRHAQMEAERLAWGLRAATPTWDSERREQAEAAAVAVRRPDPAAGPCAGGRRPAAAPPRQRLARAAHPTGQHPVAGTELLKATPSRAPGPREVEAIVSEARRLERLVSDLLDMARIEAHAVVPGRRRDRPRRRHRCGRGPAAPRLARPAGRGQPATPMAWRCSPTGTGSARSSTICSRTPTVTRPGDVDHRPSNAGQALDRCRVPVHEWLRGPREPARADLRALRARGDRRAGGRRRGQPHRAAPAWGRRSSAAWSRRTPDGCADRGSGAGRGRPLSRSPSPPWSTTDHRDAEPWSTTAGDLRGLRDVVGGRDHVHVDVGHQPDQACATSSTSCCGCSRITRISVIRWPRA